MKWAIEDYKESLMIYDASTKEGYHVAHINKGWQNAEENAQLIVSAPKLLEVLKILLKSHYRLNSKSVISDEIELMAEAVIKEATKEMTF